MAIVVTHVDDLHKAEEDRNVPADETVVLGVDGIDYDVDLTSEHATELRAYLKRYTATARPHENTPSGKKRSYVTSSGDTPLKRAKRYRMRMRAFADSRPDLGRASYMTANDNFSYTDRLEKAYAAYVAEHGEYPLPGEPGYEALQKRESR